MCPLFRSWKPRSESIIAFTFPKVPPLLLKSLSVVGHSLWTGSVSGRAAQAVDTGL